MTQQDIAAMTTAELRAAANLALVNIHAVRDEYWDELRDRYGLLVAEINRRNYESRLGGA